MFSSPSAYWPHTPAFEQERKRRGRGQEHSRWINAPHPAAHVLGKQGRGLREGSLFCIFCVCFFLFCRSWTFLFLHVLCCFDFFVVVPCCSLSFSLCHFCFPFFWVFCMRTRSRQWLHYSFFIIVCRLWSVVFVPPFFISRVRTIVHCRFPSVILLSFLGDFLASFLFIAVLSFAPVFLVVFVLRRKGLFPCLCVLCLMVWSV